jgi:hypothetical protein
VAGGGGGRRGPCRSTVLGAAPACAGPAQGPRRTTARAPPAPAARPPAPPAASCGASALGSHGAVASAASAPARASKTGQEGRAPTSHGTARRAHAACVLDARTACAGEWSGRLVRHPPARTATCSPSPAAAGRRPRASAAGCGAGRTHPRPRAFPRRRAPASRRGRLSHFHAALYISLMKYANH